MKHDRSILLTKCGTEPGHFSISDQEGEHEPVFSSNCTHVFHAKLIFLQVRLEADRQAHGAARADEQLLQLHVRLVSYTSSIFDLSSAPAAS